MAVIDGPGYDRRLLELGAGAELSREELEGLLILKTVKPAPVPLLVSAVDSDAEQAHDGKVLVPLKVRLLLQHVKSVDPSASSLLDITLNACDHPYALVHLEAPAACWMVQWLDSNLCHTERCR